MTGVLNAWAASLCLLACGAASAQGVTLPPFERVQLDNGVVLILSEKHEVPLVGIEIMLRGGAVTDQAGLEGLAALTAGLLEKGAGDRDAAAFAEAVAAVGGSLSARGGLEAITISGEFLAKDIDLMLELVADMLRRPALEPNEFTKLRDRAANQLHAAKDSGLWSLLPYYGNAFLFGDHAYGRPVGGGEASLAKIRHRDVRDYYRNHVGADRLVIAIGGDFETAPMVAKLTTAFGDWEPAATAPETPPAPAPAPGPRVLLVDKPGAAQTYFWLGAPGVAIDYPRRAALNLANTLFGGSFTSMLNSALRIESGLTYGAFSVLTRPSMPGSVAVTSFTPVESTVEAIDMTLDVLRELHSAELGEDALAAARNYLLGQFPTGLETARQIAGTLAQIEFYGLGRDYVDAYGAALHAVDTAALSATIEEVYPRADELVFVLLGDAERIREDIAKYGAVTEKPITDPDFSP